MITDYANFLSINKLTYYAIDFDDNLLHMPTKIHMDKLIEGVWTPLSISPSEYAVIRNNSDYRIRNNNAKEAYTEFRDYGPRGNQSFIEDIKISLNNKDFGPSWKSFLTCLIEANLFALITARGHESDTLKQGIKYIIDNCLSNSDKLTMKENCYKFTCIFGDIKETKHNDDYILNYLNHCRFYGVGEPYSASFKNEFNITKSLKIEQAKEMALNKFIAECNEYGKKSNLNVSIGFSDDDKKNVEHIKSYLEYISTTHSHLNLSVFDTSNKGFLKIKINESVTEPYMSNGSASITRFINTNSMPNTLQNSTNDFSGQEFNQRVKTATFLKRKMMKSDSIKKFKFKKKSK